MIEQIKGEARVTASYTGRSEFEPRVIAAMAKVPRHEFVPASEIGVAYVNAALPIGSGQTISQPFIVALMTDLLCINEKAVILDIGTGSGYQAAVLAEIAKQVYSIEVVEPLAEEARTRLGRLGYTNIEITVGDGYYGCPQHAPFDGILVAAATTAIPAPLLKQLRPGARLVIPVHQGLGRQELIVAEKSFTGEISTRSVLPVAFVPFKEAES